MKQDEMSSWEEKLYFFCVNTVPGTFLLQYEQKKCSILQYNFSFHQSISLQLS